MSLRSSWKHHISIKYQSWEIWFCLYLGTLRGGGIFWSSQWIDGVLIGYKVWGVVRRRRTICLRSSWKAKVCIKSQRWEIRFCVFWGFGGWGGVGWRSILEHYEEVKCEGRCESEGDYWLEVLPKNPMSLSSTKQSALFTPRIKALLITGPISIWKCLTKTGLKSCQNALFDF